MGSGGHHERVIQEPGTRSASAPRVRMRCDAKMGNHACEYQTANERCARRQFVSICRARARVELRIIGSRRRNARFRSRSRYR
eukprot:1385788-Pleurochrysis_carterae.AAC.1